MQRGVDPRDQALRRGLLVTRGAVDLSGKKQPRQRLSLQAGRKAARIEVVVFDCVARARDVDVLEALY